MLYLVVTANYSPSHFGLLKGAWVNDILYRLNALLTYSEHTAGQISDVQTLYQDCVGQRSMSFDEAILLWSTPAATCSMWQELVVYTGCFEPLYLYAGIAIAHRWDERLDVSTHEFMEFITPEPTKHSSKWPPDIYVDSSAIPSTEDSSQFIAYVWIPFAQSASSNVHIHCDRAQAILCTPDTYLRSLPCQVECDVSLVRRYLGRNVINLSVKHNINIGDVRIGLCANSTSIKFGFNSNLMLPLVHRNEFFYEAVLHECNPDESHPPVYFHICPMNDEHLPVPWGYFSFDEHPAENGSQILMEPCWRPTNTCEFKSTLPGVTAFVRSVPDFRFSRLSSANHCIDEFQSEGQIGILSSATPAGRCS